MDIETEKNKYWDENIRKEYLNMVLLKGAIEIMKNHPVKAHSVNGSCFVCKAAVLPKFSI